MATYTEVFVWGANKEGQLGLGKNNREQWHCLPRHCSFNIQIQHLSCGDTYTALLSSSAHVYTMGSNLNGRLGLNRPQLAYSPAPSLVEGLRNVQGISCGSGQTLAHTDTGELYVWGWNGYGALGTGDMEDRYGVTRVDVVIAGGVKGEACGGRHSVVWGSEGNVVGCGAGEILGIALRETLLNFTPIPLPEPIKQASLGVNHTAFVTVLGRVFTVGGNCDGELGIGSRVSCLWPALVASLDGVSVQKVTCTSFTSALTNSGQLYIWGPTPLGLFLTPQRLAPFPRPLLDISQGPDYGVALDQAGQVWVWGENGEGRLGLGDCAARKIPFPVKALMEKVVREISCGGGFVVALGRDMKPISHKCSSAIETARVRHTSPGPLIVESVESARSTSRIKSMCGDYESAATSTRECPVTDSPALHTLLQSHISQLSSEVQSLQQRLAQTTQALTSEQQSKQLLQTQLITFQSAPQSLETTVQQGKRTETTLKGESFEAELQQAAKSSSPFPSLHTTSDLLFLSDYDDSKEQLNRLKRDYDRVQEALERAEEHNRELVEEMDRRSVRKARDYRERSLCMLASPIRPPLADFDTNQLPTFRETGCRPLQDSIEAKESKSNPFRRTPVRKLASAEWDKV